MILHVINSGSIPDVSSNRLNLLKQRINKYFSRLVKAREAQSGRAEHWRCLGYKFKSYVGQSTNLS